MYCVHFTEIRCRFWGSNAMAFCRFCAWTFKRSPFCSACIIHTGPLIHTIDLYWGSILLVYEKMKAYFLIAFVKMAALSMHSTSSCTHTFTPASFVCAYNDSFKLLVYCHTFNFEPRKEDFMKNVSPFSCAQKERESKLRLIDHRLRSVYLVAHVQNKNELVDVKIASIFHWFHSFSHLRPPTRNSLHAFFKTPNELCAQCTSTHTHPLLPALSLSHSQHFEHWQPTLFMPTVRICYGFNGRADRCTLLVLFSALGINMYSLTKKGTAKRWSNCMSNKCDMNFCF